MANAKTSRKQLFRAALAIAGLTAAEWARQEGITAQWLSAVLNGKDTSLTLDEKIDGFTRSKLDKHTTAAA